MSVIRWRIGIIEARKGDDKLVGGIVLGTCPRPRPMLEIPVVETERRI